MGDLEFSRRPHATQTVFEKVQEICAQAIMLKAKLEFIYDGAAEALAAVEVRSALGQMELDIYDANLAADGMDEEY